MLPDLRFAIRALRRDLGFTVAATVTLTFAIALNVTVYTVMDAVLFRGYPLVQRSDRIVFLQERGPANQCCISYADFEDWRAQARSFDGLALVRGVPITFRDGDGRPSDMRVTSLDANAFRLLGVMPLLGRDFTAADERPGAPQVAILSHRFWQRRFGGRLEIVGSTVHINGLPATVIGVMPERFAFPYKADGDLWMPLVQPRSSVNVGSRPGASRSSAVSATASRLAKPRLSSRQSIVASKRRFRRPIAASYQRWPRTRT